MSSVDFNYNYQTYMDQVTERVPPLVVDSLVNIYEDAIEFCKSTKGYNPDDKQRVFVTLLGEVPAWDDQDVAEETAHFRKAAPWMFKVIKQILVAQVRILLSVRGDEYVAKPRFDFQMPSDSEIVMKLMGNAAKKMRRHVDLFMGAEPDVVAIEDLVRDSVKRTIQNLVPLSEIVSAQYGQDSAAPAAPAAAAPAAPTEAVEDEDEDEDEDDDDDEEEEEKVVEVSEDESISQDEIEKLKKKHKKDQRKRIEQYKQQHKEDHTAEKEQSGLKLIKGEEPVDMPIAGEADGGTDSLLERMAAMRRDDPDRAALREKIRRRLAN
jgi:hypothetical protein